ncbi:uncharacterized protein K441DRAFT_671070 [Cenococcum geophilum 1.58]|uniref:Uncharacterized protein n=1 Tax=Cenococcum geophilum 1.58 TaxID=794803 RepID=A0ACC8ELL3_9PEZI|nr:hypothetical protein K441DRAFT_671070 [Cenococcum geophilum 1.58]
MADYDNRLPHPTPKKAKVRGAIKYMEARGIKHLKADVFRHFKVSKRQGWAIISKGSVNQRHYNHEDLNKDNRGRPPLLNRKAIQKMENLIKEEGFKARKLSWQELG